MILYIEIFCLIVINFLVSDGIDVVEKDGFELVEDKISNERIKEMGMNVRCSEEDWVLQDILYEIRKQSWRHVQVH